MHITAFPQMFLDLMLQSCPSKSKMRSVWR